MDFQGLTEFHHPTLAFALTAAGTLLAAVTDSDLAAWTLGLTGVGMATLSIFQQYRRIRRTEDVEDERQLSDSRLRRIQEISDDLEQLRKRAHAAEVLAAERMAVIETLRATCPHHETCPVGVLQRAEKSGRPDGDSSIVAP